MAKPEKLKATKTTAEIVRAGVVGEFWKIIESYLANELADLSYAIIKKEWQGKPIDEAKVDALRKNLDFVEWHLKLPQKILDSYEDKQPEIPNYDPYPSFDDNAGD